MMNSTGRWYWITNKDAAELRPLLRRVIAEIPTGLGNEKWGPDARRALTKLAAALADSGGRG